MKDYKKSRRRNILHRVKRNQANWIGHILRRNCPLKHVSEGKITEKETRKKRKQLLDDFKEKERHCNLI
jgi:hypothetical protein